MNNRSVANGASFANGNGPGTIRAWQSGYQAPPPVTATWYHLGLEAM
jgi:hypothetical protein